jgi:hypothetical protein
MKTKVDNNGAIHVANNASSGARMKHIYTRIHFVREWLSRDDKILEIELMRSDDNESDDERKNLEMHIQMYDTGRQVGVSLRGELVVLPLSNTFDIDKTYYDYINIFWRDYVLSGYMNQFCSTAYVALANPPSDPQIEPNWVELDSWQIGAQYFMAVCDDDYDSSGSSRNSSSNKLGCEKWTPTAATGTQIAVESGEGIFVV